MANYQYTSDLLADVLFRSGGIASGDEFETVALQYLNRAYFDICSGSSVVAPQVREDWLWLRSAQPGILRLFPTLNVTVSLTTLETAGTFSAAPTYSVAGDFLQIDSESEVYTIATHTASNANFTIRDGYLGTTGTKSGKVFRLDYALAADVLRVIQPLRSFSMAALTPGAGYGGDFRIHLIDSTIMDEQWPLSRTRSVMPEYFTYTANRTIRFNAASAPAGEAYRHVEYDYLVMPAVLTNAQNEEPLVPRHRRYIIADIALALLFSDKNDSRRGELAVIAQNGLHALQLEERRRNRTNSSRAGRIYPRNAPAWGNRRFFARYGS